MGFENETENLQERIDGRRNVPQAELGHELKLRPGNLEAILSDLDRPCGDNDSELKDK